MPRRAPRGGGGGGNAAVVDLHALIEHRNRSLGEHLKVVLTENDVVLYKDSDFTSQLKTEPDSLRTERRKHIEHLENDLADTEAEITRRKITHSFENARPTKALHSDTLLARGVDGFFPDWTTEEFASVFNQKLHVVVATLLGSSSTQTRHSAPPPLSDFFPTLLRDTSSVDEEVLLAPDSSGAGGGDGAGDFDGDPVVRQLADGLSLIHI